MKIGWKYLITKAGTPVLCKLQILGGVHMSVMGAGLKYRTSRARVLEIYKLSVQRNCFGELTEITLTKKAKVHVSRAISPMAGRTGNAATGLEYLSPLEYRPGKVITVSDFDYNAAGCAPGIHYFDTRQETLEYANRWEKAFAY
jgi:hypothetical protein